jgi:hypothetical protein
VVDLGPINVDRCDVDAHARRRRDHGQTADHLHHHDDVHDLGRRTRRGRRRRQPCEIPVHSYYDAVALGDYERSWSQLTPEFQRGTARSYDYYVEFWDDNDIDVGDVDVREVDQRILVDVELRWNGSAMSSPTVSSSDVAPTGNC